jgi:hypothetical protein
MKKWLTFVLLGLIGMVAFVLIYLAIFDYQIKGVSHRFVNEMEQNHTITVYFPGNQNRGLYIVHRGISGKGIASMKENINFPPDCLKLTNLEEDSVKWVNLYDIKNVINPAWHYMPTIIEYRLTQNLADSTFCRDSYTQ